MGQALADLVAQSQAINPAVIAQIKVEKHQAVGMLAEQIERPVAVAGQIGLQAVRLKLAAQEVEGDLAVVHQQGTRRNSAGAKGRLALRAPVVMGLVPGTGPVRSGWGGRWGWSERWG